MNSTRTCRSTLGFTLIEVLASLVLLSLVATVCIPLVQQSTRWLSDSTKLDRSMQFELAMFAGDVSDDANRFGFDDANAIPTSLRWPDAPGREVVSIEPIDTSVNHGRVELAALAEGKWVRFSCSGCEAFRWFPSSDKTDSQHKRTGGEIK